MAVPMGCGLIEVAGTPNRFVAGSLSGTLFFKPSAERNQQKEKMNTKTIPSPLIAGRSLTILFNVDRALTWEFNLCATTLTNTLERRSARE